MPVAVAGGGGGGGGAGSAFPALNGGDGGHGPGTGGNGQSGALSGGDGGQAGKLGCDAPSRGGAGADAVSNTGAGGGGGGGDGICPGRGGANGGYLGGAGGGGGAGASSFWATGTGTVGIRPADGDGFVSLAFNRSTVRPAITSAASFTVPAIAAVDDNIAFRVTATGFPAPKFSLAGAPSWLSIDPDSGLIGGAVPARTAGKYGFTITADNGFASTSQAFTLDVAAAPLTLKAPGTLKGYVKSRFSAKLDASGGVGAYHWAKIAGSLPRGLSLSSSGVISGTPSSTGTSTFTVQATDSALPTAASARETVKITIAHRTLTVTTASLPRGTVGRPYAQTLAAAMGARPLKWRISTGTLPDGLSLDPATGRISGTPTRPGTSAFTATVTDASGMTASADLEIGVHPAVQAAVYTVNSGNSAVLSFGLDTDGGFVFPQTLLSGATTGLNGTTAVVIDPDGQTYVASANNASIQEFEYGVNGAVAPSATLAGPATGLAYPDAIALDESGRLYVANYPANSVTVYAPGAHGDAAPVAVIHGEHTGLGGPSALTMDSAGHLWVANLATNSLTEYAPGANGDVAPLATIAGGSTGLSGPQGMAFDAAGNLLVANTYASSLTEYKTTDTGDVAPQRTIAGPSTGLRFPHGVDVDERGDIYVANELGGTSYLFTPLGGIS
ncbi:MAG TPA: putative Ig domain-containing protein, partial [Miltoncostaeaceae bacterium]|nr:putative Ig domain-containing protein [Miltoncostaeaceae bacterium]